ncbi:spore coat protein [Marinicrinis sediminis]|uniref:Spore coat protein n=1 Tax=Marinicrinis sediminis TaxID=1652465 RepID=A0ABW5RA45_9BACL
MNSMGQSYTMQTSGAMNPQAFQLTEKDMAFQILNELKRMAREFTTACLEASCQQVRQLFEQKLSRTLSMQNQLYQTMEQIGFYSPPQSMDAQQLQQKSAQLSETGFKLQGQLHDHLHAGTSQQARPLSAPIGGNAPSYQQPQGYGQPATYAAQQQGGGQMQPRPNYGSNYSMPSSAGRMSESQSIQMSMQNEQPELAAQMPPVQTSSSAYSNGGSMNPAASQHTGMSSAANYQAGAVGNMKTKTSGELDPDNMDHYFS